MDTLFQRYRNLSILAAVLFAQVLILAFQVKRSTEAGPVRLARVWVVALITPIEKGVVHSEQAVANVWHNYIWLRGLRQENEQLRDENFRIRLEQVRTAQDAAQARRLQSLLNFKEQTISQTVAAQVIGTSGSETSRILYIDKGFNDGLKTDMAVISADGIVGKILKTFPITSQVLLITDQSSGVGAILENSRLQGILKGSASGDTNLSYVMADEKVAAGERVLTSGGDRIFPKGLPIGTVMQSSLGSDMFLNIRVKPAAPITRLEEVLVITKIEEKAPSPDEIAKGGPVRAADILAQRLPTVTVKPPDGTSSSSEPPSTAALIRQQKLQQQQQNKPVNKTTGEPPSTMQLFGRQLKQAPANANSAPKPATGGTATPGTKPATSGSTSPATPAAPKQSKPKQNTSTPPAPQQQPSTTPPGVTL